MGTDTLLKAGDGEDNISVRDWANSGKVSRQKVLSVFLGWGWSRGGKIVLGHDWAKCRRGFASKGNKRFFASLTYRIFTVLCDCN